MRWRSRPGPFQGAADEARFCSERGSLVVCVLAPGAVIHSVAGNTASDYVIVRRDSNPVRVASPNPLFYIMDSVAVPPLLVNWYRTCRHSPGRSRYCRRGIILMVYPPGGQRHDCGATHHNADHQLDLSNAGDENRRDCRFLAQEAIVHHAVPSERRKGHRKGSVPIIAPVLDGSVKAAVRKQGRRAWLHHHDAGRGSHVDGSIRRARDPGIDLHPALGRGVGHHG